MHEVPDGDTIVTRRLHLASGFLASEHDWVSAHLAALGVRLRSFRADQVDLEISLKDRQGDRQQVTLECWINRNPRLHLVATSSKGDLPSALSEVRDELVRQVDEAAPRRDRALRLVPALPEQE